ncbi:MAG: helix-turn-helix domain-containing protein [Clostridium sp.]|nr:helix-turn-helix domain-containing protein [Clostridium sp.]
MNTTVIAEYLQYLRKIHHYTQEELAARLDLSRQAVSKWETGATLPDIEM